MWGSLTASLILRGILAIAVGVIAITWPLSSCSPSTPASTRAFR
jgi:uncharacterized membrane protein HdeD (DUF308 family)